MPPRRSRRIGAARFGNLPPRAFLALCLTKRALSLDGEWFTCKIMSNDGPLLFDQAAKPVVGGMSGSPSCCRTEAPLVSCAGQRTSTAAAGRVVRIRC